MDYLERNRDFKGVWIPREIWLNDELTMLEKVILIEIDSLDNEQHCVAGNEYLSQFCQCSEWKIGDAIKKLQKLGYIEIVSFDGRHRRIRSCLRNFKVQHQEILESDQGKPKAIKIDNNLENNIAINNNVETSSTTNNFSAEIKEIVDYLNVKTQSRYRANTPNTQKHIVARLKQDYTVDDFKHVIDVKCAEWLGTDMQQYLRPDTLFGTKFDYYLQQKMPVKKPSNNFTHDNSKTPAQLNAQGRKPMRMQEEIVTEAPF